MSENDADKSDYFTPLTLDRLNEIYEMTTHHKNGIPIDDVFATGRNRGYRVQAAHEVLRWISFEDCDELSLRYLSRDGLTHFTAFYLFRGLNVMLHEFNWDIMPFESPKGLINWFNDTIQDIRSRVAKPGLIADL